jgi:hypothetical protein
MYIFRCDHTPIYNFQVAVVHHVTGEWDFGNPLTRLGTLCYKERSIQEAYICEEECRAIDDTNTVASI